jgi:hypothetical protein
MERDPAPRLAPSLAPEHEWSAACRLLHPALRPRGTVGVDGRNPRVPSGAGLPGKPLILAGPAGLAVAYVIPGPGFGVFVGAEHLLAWGVGPDEVHAAAIANLRVWSSGTPWVAEASGSRHVVWSDSGQGMDAARILLPEVRAQLAADLAATGRVLVGLPERHLLVAAGLAGSDDEFALLFAAYVADLSNAAVDPIDPRLFELVDGELILVEDTPGDRR